MQLLIIEFKASRIAQLAPQIEYLLVLLLQQPYVGVGHFLWSLEEELLSKIKRDEIRVKTRQGKASVRGAVKSADREFTCIWFVVG